VSTVIEVSARNALFLVRGQLTRSRSPHATRIDANKSATKLARQIIAYFWSCKWCRGVCVVMPKQQGIACHCPACLKTSVYKYLYGFFVRHALISSKVIDDWIDCACTLTPLAFTLLLNCVLYVVAATVAGLSSTTAL